MEIEGYEIIEKKMLIDGKLLLKYATSARDSMILLLQTPGARGGDYFGGGEHEFIAPETEYLKKQYDSINSADDFILESTRVRDRISRL